MPAGYRFAASIVWFATAITGFAVSYPTVAVQEIWASDRQLRLLVETGHYHQPLIAHVNSGTHSMSEGWLVVMDFPPAGQPRPTARVFGPLWDQAMRTNLAFRPGAYREYVPDPGTIYSEKQREAARKIPLIAFDPDGEVIRVLEHTASEPRPRARLELTSTHASWRSDGEFVPVPETWSPTGSFVHLISRRYGVWREPDGKVSVRELLTGRRVEKPWLEAAFARYLAMPELKSRIMITEELDRLVISPWGDVIYSTTATMRDPNLPWFMLHGKRYRRSEHGFYWTYPDPEPRLYRKSGVDGVNAAEFPHGALVIDDRLYLIQRLRDPAIVRLTPLEGGRRYELPEPDSTAAGNVQFHGKDLLVFTRKLIKEKKVEVTVWDYKTAQVERHQLSLLDLFKPGLMTYAPVSAIPLR